MRKFRDITRNCFFWNFAIDSIIPNFTLISLWTSAILTFLDFSFKDFVKQFERLNEYSMDNLT